MFPVFGTCQNLNDANFAKTQLQDIFNDKNSKNMITSDHLHMTD